MQTLERVCWGIGHLKSIRVEQGSEFISRDLNLRTHQRGVILSVSRRDNRLTTASCIIQRQAFAERLNMHRFTNPDDARVNLEDWHKDHNKVRRHSRDRQQGADIAAEWFIGVPPT